MTVETMHVIRAALPEEVQALAEVHVRAYHETYAGMLLHEQVQHVDLAYCSKRWRDVLSGDTPDRTAGVQIAVAAGGIVGLGCHCAQRNPGLSAIGYHGEVAALYVLQPFQGIGLGRRLMQGLARQLRQSGYGSMALWVVRENISAQSFYQRLGGDRLMDREVKNAGGSFVEIAYGWKDVDALA